MDVGGLGASVEEGQIWFGGRLHACFVSCQCSVGRPSNVKTAQRMQACLLAELELRLILTRRTPGMVSAAASARLSLRRRPAARPLGGTWAALPQAVARSAPQPSRWAAGQGGEGTVGKEACACSWVGKCLASGQGAGQHCWQSLQVCAHSFAPQPCLSSAAPGLPQLVSALNPCSLLAPLQRLPVRPRPTRVLPPGSDSPPDSSPAVQARGGGVTEPQHAEEHAAHMLLSFSKM